LHADEEAKQKHDSPLEAWSNGIGGTDVAKEETRTRRVDKGKSGQALITAVSGGFGGGILSQQKQMLTLVGERSRICDAVDEQQ
jgi:hypothetical protein